MAQLTELLIKFVGIALVILGLWFPFWSWLVWEVFSLLMLVGIYRASRIRRPLECLNRLCSSNEAAVIARFNENEREIFTSFAFRILYPSAAVLYMSAIRATTMLTIPWLILLLWKRLWWPAAIAVAMIWPLGHVVDWIFPQMRLRRQARAGNIESGTIAENIDLMEDRLRQVRMDRLIRDQNG